MIVQMVGKRQEARGRRQEQASTRDDIAVNIQVGTTGIKQYHTRHNITIMHQASRCANNKLSLKSMYSIHVFILIKVQKRIESSLPVWEWGQWWWGLRAIYRSEEGSRVGLTDCFGGNGAQSYPYQPTDRPVDGQNLFKWPTTSIQYNITPYHHNISYHHHVH